MVRPRNEFTLAHTLYKNPLLPISFNYASVKIL
jgi:hypothetical protein